MAARSRAPASTPPTTTETAREIATLMAGLRAHDPAVAAPLWRRFAPTVCRLLQRMMGPRIPVDTTAQVVLLCVFHRGSRLGPDADQADLARLVVRTTVRIASAELRQPSLGWFRSALRGRAVREPKARDRSEQDALLRFYRILDGLGVAERIAFVLHKIEGLDVPTVAAAMASSPERTSRRLDRSIRKVSAALERDPVLRPSGAG